MKLKPEHVILSLIFILSFIFKLYFLTRYPLLYGMDAGYYLIHVGEILDTGFPDIGFMPPLVFYYLAVFAFIFRDLTIGIKVGSALLSAAMAIPFYLLLEFITKSKKTALLGAFLGTFSYASLLIVKDLLKNVGGLFFGLFFVYFLLRAFDNGKKHYAALAIISFLLMLATHFSSTAYLTASVFPFLVLLPFLEYWETRSFTFKAKVSALIVVFIIICAGIIILLDPSLLTDEGIGTLGIQHLAPGHNWFNFSILYAYSFLLIPMILGLFAAYKISKKYALLFFTWLFVSFLLMQPIFVEQNWVFRFEYMAYLVIVPLIALGAEYFVKQEIIFYPCAAIIMLLAFLSFWQSGMQISPIITLEEWNGFLELKQTLPPGSTLTGIFGGVEYWAEAAGFEVLSPEDKPNSGKTFIITQTDRLPSETVSKPIASFGRFKVYRSQDFGYSPTNQCGNGICDPFEYKHELVCPKDCPK
jgi:hypothetical protein